MKGIYLTEEAKQEIEDKVIFLISMGASEQIINKLKKILESAKILPVEDSWDTVNGKSDYGLSDKEFYANGVIIKNKHVNC
jgi:hypothetical protein